MDGKWRLLFVDDESGILATMRRIMWKKREQWQVSFAGSGSAGLELVRTESPQVVISDLRMPGMDGVEFLTQVAELLPGTVRIIMTGHSSMEAFLRAVGPVHLMLYKPVDPERFLELIERLGFLFALPVSSASREFLGSITSLPTVQANHHQLLQLLNDPGCTFDKLSETIAVDPALTAKILHLINSAHFGISRRVVRLEDAIRLLGMDTIRALTMGTFFFSRFDTRVNRQFLERLANYSMQVAYLSRVIIGRLTQDPHARDEAFLAGVLHEIGCLVWVAQTGMNIDLPCAINEVIAAAESAEPVASGPVQGWMGAFLLGLWGFSETIMNVSAYRSCPELSPAVHCPVLAAVHLACAKVTRTPPSQVFLERIGLAASWPTWELELDRQLPGGAK